MTRQLIFLSSLRPGGPWVLSAIVPDGPIETITALTPSDVRAFVARYDGKRNIYFGVNPTREVLNRKAAKTDIAAIEYVLADCDPNPDETSAEAKARYCTQLETFEPRPSFVIDSGNGIQLLWRLSAPIVLGKPRPSVNRTLRFSPEDQAKIDEAEACCAAVMAQLNAKAGTQNIDRILRLPGTINLPNAKKKREGRVTMSDQVDRLPGRQPSTRCVPRAQKRKKIAKVERPERLRRTFAKRSR